MDGRGHELLADTGSCTTVLDCNVVNLRNIGRHVKDDKADNIRAAAFAFVPGLSIVICAIFAASGMIALFAITGSVLLICQIIHILLVRRWAAARQM